LAIGSRNLACVLAPLEATEIRGGCSVEVSEKGVHLPDEGFILWASQAPTADGVVLQRTAIPQAPEQAIAAKLDTLLRGLPCLHEESRAAEHIQEGEHQ
jgi:hypothetical protein